MAHFPITDWDNAYANGANIAGSSAWPEAWAGPAKTFRETMSAAGRAALDLAYGPHERQMLDLFLPEGEVRGLVVYIHGGYWMAFDKSWWSHFAAGPVANGFAVAMPSYRLAPEVTLSEIHADCADALSFVSGMVPGPIRLTGHSAGGHLAARLSCLDARIPAVVSARIDRCVPISGLFDLRPLQRTKMNETLKISDDLARAESPALLDPVEGLRLTAWVGGAERDEFRRQNRLIATIWRGLGVLADIVEEPDRHHFNVVDGLCDPDHPLTQELTG